MEMALEAATVLPHPKITEAIEDLYERIDGDPLDVGIRSVTIIALLGDPDDEMVAAYGIDQGDTPVQLRTLALAVTGQDPAMPGDERAAALRGPFGKRPADLRIAERRQPPDFSS